MDSGLTQCKELRWSQCCLCSFGILGRANGGQEWTSSFPIGEVGKTAATLPPVGGIGHLHTDCTRYYP